MPPSRNRIGELLVKARILDEMQLRSALAQLEQWGGRLSRVVVEMKLAQEETVTEAICQGLGMQRVLLGNVTRDAGALAKVDVATAEQKGVFPVALRDGGKTLVLAMADPTDLNLVDQLQSRTRLRVVPMVAGDREIEHAILRHYRNQEPPASFGTRFNPTPRQSSSSTEEEEEEFKVTDMSGKTLVRHINDIAPPPASPPPEPPAPAPVPSSSAADLLDELLAGDSPPPAAELTPEELQRLEVVRTTHEKSSKMLRALLELLFEKGTVAQRELAARMKQ